MTLHNCDDYVAMRVYSTSIRNKLLKVTPLNFYFYDENVFGMQNFIFRKKGTEKILHVVIPYSK